MVDSTLTNEMIENGKKLIRKLDDSNVRPSAAFWFYRPDIQEWKLVLVFVSVGKNGPKQVYSKIQTIISNFPDELSPLSLNQITLAKPDYSIAKLLRGAIRTGPGISGIWFENSVINGTVIEGAYIYRLA
ncbi:conserved hypothetical protein [uncultured Desulfobacterium sp.]|uniref:Uncharacterized protein n=1 Tax=uncultured Desulfobacterium sp. TaxID=201089 RepID=A0A445N1W6_9BACT|nr:conserved hypothetical protein [uncultured Desulfobacterium sp.]